MTVGRLFGKSGRALAVAAAIVAAIGLTTVPRPADAGGGVEVGSALVPPSGSGSELSPSVPCSQTPITTTRITTPTPTTRLPRLTIHRRRTIRPRGAVGAPITITTTLVE